MIDKLLVGVFGMVLLVVISMQLLLWSLPIFMRMEFDAICHQYTLLMDQRGGLSTDLENRLAGELASRGFSVKRISSTEHATYGDSLDLYVGAGFESRRFNSIFKLQEVIISVEYQSSTVCRVIKAFGEVQ